MKEQKKTELIVCDICGVKAARIIRRPQVLGRGESMMLVENVPVIVCRNCDESYMTSETMHELDSFRSNRKAKTKSRKIVVTEFV
jgi:YgiT-type zinc finger domain-containing protein